MERARALGIVTPKDCRAPTTPSWGKMGGRPLSQRISPRNLGKERLWERGLLLLASETPPWWRESGKPEEGLSLRKAEAGHFERPTRLTNSHIPLLCFPNFLFISY